jgi:hypothetical protein
MITHAAIVVIIAIAPIIRTSAAPIGAPAAIIAVVAIRRRGKQAETEKRADEYVAIPVATVFAIAMTLEAAAAVAASMSLK